MDARLVKRYCGKDLQKEVERATGKRVEGVGGRFRINGEGGGG